MLLTNNQVGRLQLIVSHVNRAAHDLRVGLSAEYALSTFSDLLLMAEGWGDLDKLADGLKTLYNTNAPVSLEPLTQERKA